LRIALVTELFYPHMAGCERRFFEIGRRLVASGHEVHVFTIHYDRSLLKEEMIQGMFVHRYAYSRNYIRPKASRSLNGVMRYSFLTFMKFVRGDFDVCYSNQWPMVHSFFLKLSGTLVVQEWCEVWSNSLRADILQNLIKILGLYSVAVSDFTKQRLINHLKFNPQEISVVPNGVDKSLYSGVLKNKKRGRIIYVGRLVPHKHVDLLVDAFREIKIKIPNAELHIVGTGQLLSALKEKASNINDCFVHGFIPDEQMCNLLKTAWVFVLPSEREGSGIVALEAMAAGVPVITTDYPDNAVKELSKYNCCSVAKPNAKSIASKILMLYDNDEDWLKMSQNALNFSSNYDWGMISKQLEDVLCNVVSNA
jgi:glycosyltransferase involved in cell wall biosynthesis